MNKKRGNKSRYDRSRKWWRTVEEDIMVNGNSVLREAEREDLSNGNTCLWKITSLEMKHFLVFRSYNLYPLLANG